MITAPDSDTRARRRQPEERPAQILDAAFAEFGERGLAGARLDDIARRAGVAKGTIYIYFPNKEALFREMVRTTIVARIEQAERDAESETGSATDQLRAFMTRWWEYLRTPTYTTIHRLVIAELRAFPDLAEFYSREVIIPAHSLLGGIIRRGVASGEFRAVEPAVAARMMSSMFISQALWCGNREVFKQAGFPADDALVLAQITDFVLHALDAPASPPGSDPTSTRRAASPPSAP
jgi:AcrR family transcriptional regulator